MFSAKPVQADRNAVIFMYSDQEPYVVVQGTKLGGFLYDYVNKASTLAAFTPHWSNVPWEKQIPTLKRATGNICALTLFKTKKRADFLKFSAPVGSNGRFVVLATKKNKRLVAHSSFAELLDDPALSPILQAGTKHNDYIDSLLAAKAHPTTQHSKERIVRSMLTSSAHYLILPELRAHNVLRRPANKSRLAVYSHFHDLSEESLHYIGCSRSTSDAVIERLNAAIGKLGPAKPE